MRAPYVKIYLKTGEDLSQYIEDFSYSDSAERENNMEFTVNPVHAVQFLDRDDVKTGTKINFVFGYAGERHCANMTAKIKDIEADYGSYIKITIRCTDAGPDLKRVTSKRIWSGVTSYQIAQEIALKYGLKLSSHRTTSTWDSLPQGTMSDFDFLHYLAKREDGGNFIFYIRNDTLYFVRRGLDNESIRTFTYGNGSDVILFRPKLRESEGAGDSNAVRVGSDGVIVESDASDSAEDVVTGSQRIVYDENGNETGDCYNDPAPDRNRQELVTPTGSETEAKNLAASVRKKAQLNGFTAELEVEGDPLIVPDCIVTVKGVAKRHEGNWWITEVKHSLRSGGAYTTVIMMQKNAQNFKTSSVSVDGTTVNDTVGADSSQENKVTLFLYDENGNRINPDKTPYKAP